MKQEHLKDKTPVHVREHFKACKNSGLTIKAYCSQYDINLGTFYYWRKNYIVRDASQNSGIFQELTFPVTLAAVCSIRFPNGISVSINRGATEHELKPVLAILQKIASC